MKKKMANSRRGSSVDIIVTAEEKEHEKLTTEEFDKIVKTTRFTEFEIVQLWNSFKCDYPSGEINRIQLSHLVRKVFPKCDDELVTENIIRVFDPYKTGTIRFCELLMAFSMSMRGTVEEKLKWAFKLYDKDGSGEIDREEMEEIFTKLCKISSTPPSVKMIRTSEKRKVKPVAAPSPRPPEERKNAFRKKSTEVQSLVLMSSKHRHKPVIKKPKPTSEKTNGIRRKSLNIEDSIDKGPMNRLSRRKSSSSSVDMREKDSESDPGEEETILEVKEIDPELVKFLQDPERDCTKFDVKARANELFDILDEDGSGAIDQHEFIDGCMLDSVFVEVLDKFDGTNIWGFNNAKPATKSKH